MKQRIYIDTSVVGGYFDSMFAEITKDFFSKVIETKTILVVSNLLTAEVNQAPESVVNFFNSLPKELIENINISDEAEKLANLYIKEKVVGESSRDDCLHIACATENNVSVLVSWNFKHIVNLPKIRGYNSINTREGYHILEIRNPKEIFKDE